MNIENRTVLLLGGSGLVGMAVARQLAAHKPRTIVVSGLTRNEAETAVQELRAESTLAGLRLEAEWGDLFVPAQLKDRSRADILNDAGARARLLDDIYGELTEEGIQRSTLVSLLARWQPEIVVDCVNTATAFAYQNVFDSAAHLRNAVAAGATTLDDVERHLALLYLPQLIRHVQLTLEALRRAGTTCYIKVGTAGTGGMGLNIPFTHSEERPSRMLLAKSSVAGAHTLLLYLMARTPGAPAVKEIKPTAAISWKRISHGVIQRKGQPIECYDADRALPLEEAFAESAARVAKACGRPLQGVYLDAGENGLFSMGEFEVLTALGLMEYITPEEIAENVVREIRGYPTGRDIVAALDAATSGPTYRAGVLRETALVRMAELEQQHQVESVAFEMLGPPRLSKLLFEAAILARVYPDLCALAGSDAEETARRTQELIATDTDLRTRILSIGLPILQPDGLLLRGPEVKVSPDPGQSATDPRLADNGWVDLRPQNWRKWRERAASMLREASDFPGPDQGSRHDGEPGTRDVRIRPGRLVAWVFRREDSGERTKR
jgi:NAD(P)-dependent dehydrogenase (short-subunit alcohol dehydrogenase family)